MTIASHPITIRHLRVGRLTRAVDTLLDAIARGDVTPSLDELLALHAICIEQGAYEAAGALRDHLESHPDLIDAAQTREGVRS